MEVILTPSPEDTEVSKETLVSWADALKTVIEAQELLGTVNDLKSQHAKLTADIIRAKTDKTAAEGDLAQAKKDLEAGKKSVTAALKKAQADADKKFQEHNTGISQEIDKLYQKRTQLTEDIIAKQTLLDNVDGQYQKKLQALNKDYGDKLAALQTQEKELSTSIDKKQKELQALRAKFLKMAEL